MLEELKYLQVVEQKALKARMATSAWLTCLKKVYKKVRLKK
jgi:hypothetical protein